MEQKYRVSENLDNIDLEIASVVSDKVAVRDYVDFIISFFRVPYLDFSLYIDVVSQSFVPRCSSSFSYTVALIP